MHVKCKTYLYMPSVKCISVYIYVYMKTLPKFNMVHLKMMVSKFGISYSKMPFSGGSMTLDTPRPPAWFTPSQVWIPRAFSCTCSKSSTIPMPCIKSWDKFWPKGQIPCGGLEGCFGGEIKQESQGVLKSLRIDSRTLEPGIHAIFQSSHTSSTNILAPQECANTKISSKTGHHNMITMSEILRGKNPHHGIKTPTSSYISSIKFATSSPARIVMFLDQNCKS